MLDEADVVYILRRKDNAADMQCRIEYGIALMCANMSRVLLFSKDNNTRAEADRLMGYMKALRWKSVMIVTSEYHHYRAYLTFLKSMKAHGLNIRLIDASTPSKNGVTLDSEFARIEEYQKTGDVASYEEGIAWIQDCQT